MTTYVWSMSLIFSQVKDIAIISSWQLWCISFIYIFINHILFVRAYGGKWNKYSIRLFIAPNKSDHVLAIEWIYLYDMLLILHDLYLQIIKQYVNLYGYFELLWSIQFNHSDRNRITLDYLKMYTFVKKLILFTLSTQFMIRRAAQFRLITISTSVNRVFEWVR